MKCFYGPSTKVNCRKESSIYLSIKENSIRNNVSNLINDFDDSVLLYLIDSTTYDDLHFKSLKSCIKLVEKKYYKKDLETNPT